LNYSLQAVATWQNRTAGLFITNSLQVYILSQKFKIWDAVWEI
tara:strand:- start:272 stop:400 length:129 start_codon:yes stop_codon:yes gene_type:complete